MFDEKDAINTDAVFDEKEVIILNIESHDEHSFVIYFNFIPKGILTFICTSDRRTGYAGRTLFKSKYMDLWYI